MKAEVIITAGGKSQRYGENNKLFEKCGQSCVLIEAIKPFLQIPDIKKIIVGIETSFADEFLAAADEAGLAEERRIVLSAGGASRTETVKNALSAVDDDTDYILIHDGARPFVSQQLISQVIQNATEYGVALPLLRLTDAAVSISRGVQPVDRETLRLVQTPFCACKELIIKAYQNAQSTFYDDLSVIKTCFSGEIGIVEGDRSNIKITFNEDLCAQNNILAGCGYDIHRTTRGNGIRLLGVDIPCDMAFIAHSDGDVPVHALMDAILSAIGERDIGHFFPVDDKKYDGANSMELLSSVLEIARAKGYEPSNASVTIIAQRPYISPHIDSMKSILSVALGIERSRIGISATTNEEVGEIGDGKAVAAYATVAMKRTV